MSRIISALRSAVIVLTLVTAVVWPLSHYLMLELTVRFVWNRTNDNLFRIEVEKGVVSGEIATVTDKSQDQPSGFTFSLLSNGDPILVWPIVDGHHPPVLDDEKHCLFLSLTRGTRIWLYSVDYVFPKMVPFLIAIAALFGLMALLRLFENRRPKPSPGRPGRSGWLHDRQV